MNISIRNDTINFMKTKYGMVLVPASESGFELHGDQYINYTNISWYEDDDTLMRQCIRNGVIIQ